MRRWRKALRLFLALIHQRQAMHGRASPKAAAKYSPTASQIWCLKQSLISRLASQPCFGSHQQLRLNWHTMPRSSARIPRSMHRRSRLETLVFLTSLRSFCGSPRQRSTLSSSYSRSHSASALSYCTARASRISSSPRLTILILSCSRESSEA